MAPERLLIIGGVAAGMSAASRARKLRPEMDIVVLEKGRDVSYGACGLPYYLSARVAQSDELVVYDAEFFRRERNIDVRLQHEAVEIEPGKKTVQALDRGAHPVSFRYDKLVIATGGQPDTTLPGADSPRVFTCNTLQDAIRLRAFLEQQQPRRAVIIGSGYIGLEVADALASHGIQVTLLERSGALLGGFDREVNAKVEQTLSARGVRFVKHALATAIGEADGACAVDYGTSSRAVADFVVLSTGIRPRVGLAEAAGITLGPTGAIAVDERMLTSITSIYAAGDCAETTHLVTGRPAYLPLGTTANKQGRVAGENAAGGNARFAGVVGTLVTQVFELGVGKTGLSTEEARQAGFHPDSVTITSISRAKYFDGKPLLVTLIWDKAGGRLLGCQMAGEEGVAKRLDVAALALHHGMRIEDMLHLDLSYAPPFAPVWDPLLIAANEAYKKHTGAVR